MRKLTTLIAVLALFIIVSSAWAFMVTVDANLTEWPVAALNFEPNEPDINDGLDIAVQGQTNDAENLYGAFQTYAPSIWRVSLPTAAGAQPYVTVCLDADGDPSTGENRPSLCSGIGGYDYFFDVAMCNPPNFPPCADQPVKLYDLYDCTVGTQNGSLADCAFTEGAVAGSTTAWAGDTTEWSVPLATLPGFNITDACNDPDAPKTRYVSMFYNGAGEYVQDPDDTTSFSWEIDCTLLSTEIALFNANIGIDGLAHVSWHTISEETTEGFYVYRSDNPDQMPAEPQSEYIPAQNAGATTGASYEWVDITQLPLGTTYYWLEVYDADGITSIGPVDVTQSAAAVEIKSFSAQASPFGGTLLPVIATTVIGLFLVVYLLHRP
ncbi:MAG: hypothetical protein KDJ52_28470 [Anaerolineae bacterium]|nr:hypothetical protein [Anaerolineae bacterium]